MKNKFSLNLFIPYALPLFFGGCILLSFAMPANGQSWQWGKSGGGPNSSIAGSNERVMDIATDGNGNVYAIANAVAPGIVVNGQTLPGYGLQDAVLVSYNCNGVFRWSKVIGGPNHDVASSSIYHVVKTDPLGHVYIAGFISSAASGPSSIGGDTTLPLVYNKRLYIAQYDTAGTFQWLRMPQPDTMSSTYANRYQFLDMEVDAQGNVYWYGILNAGLMATGTNLVIPTRAPYILKYDAQGNFTGHVALDMTIDLTSNFLSKIARDPNSGNFYISGTYNSGNVSIGGQPINKPAYAAAFNTQGQHLWSKQNTASVGAAFLSRPVIDNNGDIYFAGYSSHGDSFNGYIVANLLTTIPHGIPWIIKLTSGGSLVWGKNGSSTGGCVGEAVAIRNSNEVTLAGSYGRLVWDGDSLWHASNQGYDVFLARFNPQTGGLIGLDSISSPFGFDDHAHTLTADANGNLYIGGQLSGQLTVGNSSVQSIGGNTDFFIAKYGSANCNCSPPLAGYSFTAPGNSLTAGFTYTGTTPVDSMRWYFGDGNSSTAVNPSHTYASGGSYNVCVVVYNDCGMDSSCQSVTINCPAPAASFSYTGNTSTNTVSFTYTGSVPVDSVKWSFGDGNFSNSTNPSHTYMSNGSYTACITAYNQCGSKDSCRNILITTSVGSIPGMEDINIYPNPAKDNIFVDGVTKDCSYRLYSLSGSILREGTLSIGTSNISLSGLSAGMYVLEFASGGEKMRVVVE